MRVAATVVWVLTGITTGPEPSPPRRDQGVPVQPFVHRPVEVFGLVQPRKVPAVAQFGDLGAGAWIGPGAGPRVLAMILGSGWIGRDGQGPSPRRAGPVVVVELTARRRCGRRVVEQRSIGRGCGGRIGLQAVQTPAPGRVDRVRMRSSVDQLVTARRPSAQMAAWCSA